MTNPETQWSEIWRSLVAVLVFVGAWIGMFLWAIVSGVSGWIENRLGGYGWRWRI